ncbi:hypothetical protein MmiHf6_03810 [Methanimicrococcus hongohii]|uniref:4Fe-4S ferredoxin-type domain-containing protein n=1 Tax=Methanimicrococcus hongohii TaxID=3028295 RepID=A0AA96UYQ2_9EURY|nr:4Fe-4S dicluster domain-containing protein [Methanimicrococcus sp. Hf6]WNY23082.1 hypothetical protein MmiHf6_03810 [Methanimicrococcus sp. Hf6]
MTSFYRFLSEKQAKSEIPLFGFASVSEWEKETKYPVPPEFFPNNIYPEVETAIVIGVPVILPIIETTPSVYYNEHYHTLNAYLDSQALQISYFLNQKSMPTVPIPRDGYAGINALKKNPAAAFSHKHAAYHAGLGSFGRNNVILTKEYGPRVRFTTILTAASTEELGVPESVQASELKAFELKASETKKQNLCIDCMACARMCPAGAITDDKSKPYPISRIDKTKCTNHSGELGLEGISPCGVCIKVCPIGEDRILFNRKNISIYNEKSKNEKSKNENNENKNNKNENDENKEKLMNAWDHVRSYGTK